MTLDELLQQARKKADAAGDAINTRVGNITTSDGYKVPVIYQGEDFIAFARTALPLLVKIVEEYRNLASNVGSDVAEYWDFEACETLVNELIEKEMKP